MYEEDKLNLVVPQFRDITEMLYSPDPDYNKFDPDKVETEFVFWLAAGEGKNLKGAEDVGFKHVSTMNNWWPTHRGEDRMLRLMWLKLPDKKNLEADPVRERWCYHQHNYEHYDPITVDMACSGCGFKIAEPPLKKKTLNAAGWYRFFTLLRLPLGELKPLEQKYMKLNHFRFLDSGKLAQYWVNGWEPKEYNFDMEYAFFKTSKSKWEADGMKGWNKPRRVGLLNGDR